MGLILLIILIVLLIAVVPAWPYSSGWGYRPFGLLGLILVIVLGLILFKVISLWDVEIDEDTIKIERKY